MTPRPADDTTWAPLRNQGSSAILVNGTLKGFANGGAGSGFNSAYGGTSYGGTAARRKAAVA
jgi:hypothetical protein